MYSLSVFGSFHLGGELLRGSFLFMARVPVMLEGGVALWVLLHRT